MVLRFGVNVSAINARGFWPSPLILCALNVLHVAKEKVAIKCRTEARLLPCVCVQQATAAIELREQVKCLTDFATDGCTMAPDLVFSDCCVDHDIYYATTIIDRHEADKRLRKCIAARGFPALSWVYWLGVRLFGWYPYYFGFNYELRLEYDALQSNSKMKNGHKFCGCGD